MVVIVVVVELSWAVGFVVGECCGFEWQFLCGWLFGWVGA